MAADPRPNSLRDMLRWFVEPVPVHDTGGAALPAGTMLHAVREIDGRVHRYHLRIEPDGNGLLVVDAATAVRLPPVVTRFAADSFRWASGDQVGLLMNLEVGRLPDREQRALDDFTGLWQQPAQAAGRYPISNLIAAEGATGIHGRFAAPLEADVPLPDPSQIGPLIDALWAAGIPHVTFVAPPGFAAEHLVRAVERAEDTGMIAGVRVRGGELAVEGLLEALAQAGVDHVNVPVASTASATHDALFGAGDHAAALDVLKRVKALEICPVAEVPLVESTVAGLGKTLAALAELVADVECFAVAAPDEMAEADRAGALPARALPQVAATLEDLAERLDLGLVWAPPVRRDPRLTMAAQVLAGPRCAGDVAVAVEPDGSVIPPHGPRVSAGNIVTDDWASIWASPAFAVERGDTERPGRCEVCPGLVVCATGCPRDVAGWTWEGEA